MTRTCDVCATPTKKTCTGCARAAYCSQKCQNQDWSAHIVDCDNPGRKVTSADYLAATVFRKQLKMGQETLQDYGFSKLVTDPEYEALGAVYEEVLKDLGVKTLTLDRWQREGKLFEEIVALYKKSGRDASSKNFRWLIQRPEVFSNKPLTDYSAVTNYMEDVYKQIWKIIGGAEGKTQKELENRVASWPKHKQRVFLFYIAVLSLGGPNLDTEGSLWLEFGYCVFNEPRHCWLIDLYQDLIHRSSFDEFCEAYRTSSLIALMDCKGLTEDRSDLPPEFELILSTPSQWTSTIWSLKGYIAWHDAGDDYRFFIPYGFANCRNPHEVKRLRTFYSRLFKEWEDAPFKLQKAAENDAIFEYVNSIPAVKMSKVEKRFLKRVLKTHNRMIFGKWTSIPDQLFQLKALAECMVLYMRPNSWLMSKISETLR
ncbi:hypothetical protein SISNIDRAFT_447611 [Sistotremastrum niveocremeum HHB9708]|uniref:MYND-type domain-containing protein n=1 Tax=Sistotremastrum niveocremeum HHB9708 TaxID=1314777 RepID=A0A165ACQ1_9AGAM|nr:hypothetical protein SISNIDRAFT_447611 [Sistotremastrum niveocremeum HHB9708]